MRALWLATVGIIALGGSTQAQETGHWQFVETDTGGKIGWLEPAWPDEFSGPFLDCREPGSQVVLVVMVDGLKDGQSPKLRFSRGSETVVLDGQVGPDEEFASAMIGPSHPVYALFRSTGTLTVQVGGKPKETFNLASAPAAFAKFAKACRLAGGRTAAPSNASLVRIAIPHPSPGRIPSHFNGAM